MEVTTKKIIDSFKCDDALCVSIEGYESLFVISDSDKREPGTDTILTLRPVHPWTRMNEEKFIQCIRTVIPNPAVQIDIKTDKGCEIHSGDYFDKLVIEPLLDYSWHNDKNIKKVEIDLTCDDFSFKGKGCIGILVRNGIPVEEIEILSKDVEIDEKTYTLSSKINYEKSCISVNTTSISVDGEGVIGTNTSYSEKFKSKSSLSIHGIEVPCNLFSDYTNWQSKTIIGMPFPFSFRLDIGQNGDLNLNTARDQIIYDEKWLLFEENLYRTICKQLVSILDPSDWEILRQIIRKGDDSTFSKIAQQFTKTITEPDTEIF
jgi:hypothetical protein